MKIAVLNFSGNVGKTTTARHLLTPRIPDASFIPIETINSDGTSDEALKGKEFGKLMEFLAISEAAVVDVGASNVEDFIYQMEQFKGSHEDFDYFVIPIVPATKQQRDTIATIDALAKIGIDPSKIRVIFNQVESGDNAMNLFAPIVKYHKIFQKFTLIPESVIHTNELFGLLKDSTQSIPALLEDPTDYRAKIKEAETKEEKIQYSHLLSIKRLAMGVNDELDHVFETLFA